MRYLDRKLDLKVGRPPGFINDISEHETEGTIVKLIQYNEHDFDEKEIHDVTDLEDLDTSKINWIDIEGNPNTPLVRKIVKFYNIHDMIVEDIFYTNHIPKYEEGVDYLLFVLKSFSEIENNMNLNHVTLIMKNNFVMSFRENPTNLLPPKLERIKNSIGRARKKGADYLFFVLLDTFIDSYYYYFEKIREEITQLDATIQTRYTENHIKKIYNLKNNLTSIRKNLFPIKIAMNQLLSDNSDLIEDENYVFFNDCKDHIAELTEYYDSFGELIIALITLNENNINNSTNRVMKVLTIIATLFIPMTFIAGIYGMNFKFMPELDWQYGYLFAIGLMFLTGMAIVSVLKWKKWF